MMKSGITTRVNPKLASQPYDPTYILSLTLDIGEEMLTCGAEVNRIEDSIFRILNSYGYQKVNVFCISEYIAVSFLDLEGKVTTDTRRVYCYSNNMHRLDELNSLCRYICSNKPDIHEIHERLNAIQSVSYGSNIYIQGLANFMASGGFTIFFGGSLFDGFVSGFIGILIMFCNRFSKIQAMNKILYSALASLFVSTVAILLYTIGFGNNLDKIMIGNIMLLIPGMALTTSIRDMLCGDIIAGLLRLIESLMIAGAIALGYAIPLFILGGLL